MQLKDFNTYLAETGEVGHVEKIVHSILYISGIPSVRLNEIVLFEQGLIGQVIGLSKKYVEVLKLSSSEVLAGERVVRTLKPFQIVVCDDLLGKVVDPLGRKEGKVVEAKICEERLVDTLPLGMMGRTKLSKPFSTGVSIVDLIVPLSHGQRELVIGDRKTGKTQFLLQTLLSQARAGSICIYAAIGKKSLDIKFIENFITENKIEGSTVVVASHASDPSGLIYLTPYTAMTIAEFFVSLGYHVFIVLDDLITHANHYREISLMAKRFPGRNSYPGDIFYIHSRLLERAGNFIKEVSDSKGKKTKVEVSITAMPVAELVLGDLSGYIQTNLMAMTDGHIYFDTDLYNKGIRPPINAFLSVTRVGRQTQTPLLRDINRQVTSFLLYVEKLKEFMHFGAELSETTKRTIGLGDRISEFFNQSWRVTIPGNINIIVIGALWGGFWKETAPGVMKKAIVNLATSYYSDKNFQKTIDDIVSVSKNLADLVVEVKKKGELFKD